MRMSRGCCLGVAYFLAKSEPVLLIKVLLIKKCVPAMTLQLKSRKKVRVTTVYRSISYLGNYVDLLS